MEPLSARSILSGALFGAALTAAGVYSPTVIIKQMHFEDFHMMKAFFSAAASSALAIVLANKLLLSSAKPRTPNSLNRFSKYDGNLIGGAVLGAGMALTGACPGTVLPQLATGIPSASYVLIGGLLGGILYSRYGKSLALEIKPDPKFEVKQVDRPTIDQVLRINGDRAFVIYETLCLSIVAAVSYLAPNEGVLIPGAVGGLLIGTSQFTSLLLTGNTLGVSTAYEQLGDLFWWAQDTVIWGKSTPAPSIKSTAFVLGSVLGSWGLGNLLGIRGESREGEVVVGALRAVVGGVLLTFGSRVAGGCTSGHGISGMSLLSVASFVSVGAMFAGGM
ncbi:hypothetical protein N431DRAFT_292609, partial [Stipitochalara longipes BDJ]